jgi:hypothetical protein
MSPTDTAAASETKKKNDPIDAVKITDKIAQYSVSSNNGGLPAISLEFFPPKSHEGVLVSPS